MNQRTLRTVLPCLALFLWVAPATSADGPTLIHTLDNGLEVAIFRDPRLPLVQIQALLPAGSREEGPLEGGAARMCALLLTRGTTSRTAEAFATEVERLGGALSANSTADFATVSGMFRAPDLEAGLELVADAIINPRLSETELENARRELLNALLRTRAQLGYVADEHLWGISLRGHPYSKPELGTPEAVSALTRERVAAFHRAHYRPRNSRLAISGDVDPEAVLALLRDRFGSWAGEARLGQARPPAEAQGVAVRLLNVPGSREAEVRIGFPTPGRGSAEAAPLIVANEILGGGPDSRLARGVGRPRRSWSVIQLYRDGGLLTLGSSTSVDSVPSAIERFGRALKSLSTDPPAAGEVSAKGRALARSFQIENEATGSRAGQWLLDRALGIDADPYAERVRQVSAEDVRAAARRLDPDRAWIVVAGDSAALSGRLAKLGRLEVVSIQTPPIATVLEAARRTDEPDPESRRRGKALVDQALAAHGGLPRLKAVRTSRIDADVTLQTQGEPVRGRQTEVRVEPSRLRVESLFVQLSTVQVLDGDQGWSLVTTGSRDSVLVEDAEGVAGLRDLFSSDLVHVLLAAADPQARVAWRGTDEIGGAAMDVVEVIDSGGERRVLYLDRARHMVVAVERNQGADLSVPTLRRTWSQFRPEGSIQWPHHEERRIGGVQTMTLSTTRVAINPAVDDEIFRKPSTSTSHRRR